MPAEEYREGVEEEIDPWNSTLDIKDRIIASALFETILHVDTHKHVTNVRLFAEIKEYRDTVKFFAFSGDMSPNSTVERPRSSYINVKYYGLFEEDEGVQTRGARCTLRAGLRKC